MNAIFRILSSWAIGMQPSDEDSRKYSAERHTSSSRPGISHVIVQAFCGKQGGSVVNCIRESHIRVWPARPQQPLKPISSINRELQVDIKTNLSCQTWRRFLELYKISLPFCGAPDAIIISDWFPCLRICVAPLQQSRTVIWSYLSTLPTTVL